MNDFKPEFIIIGSGPAGVSAAIPLVSAGRRVLMVDGGSISENITSNSKWVRRIGSDLRSLRIDDGTSPKLQTPMARELIEAFQIASGIKGENFTVIGSMGRGGLSNVWGGHLSLLDDADLADWPIMLSELQPSYEAVMARMGLSTTGGISSPVTPNLPAGAIASEVLRRYVNRSQPDQFRLWPALNAVRANAEIGKLQCDLNADCLFGCARGAIYSSASDLQALARYSNFLLAEKALIVDVQRGGGGDWTVVAADGRRFCSSRVLLAAGVLGNLSILRKLIEFPAGGLRIYNSPTIALPMMAPKNLFLAPRSTHSLAQLGFSFRYGAAQKDYLTGALYEVRSLQASSFINRIPLGRRGARVLFDMLSSSLAVATAYFPGDQSQTFINIDKASADLKLVVRGGFAEEFESKAKKIKKRLSLHWRRLGLFQLPGASIAAPGTDAHFAGTFPMGSSNKLATTNLGELRGFDGLYLVDGSILPTLPSKYITLTIMANADRIARNLEHLR